METFVKKMFLEANSVLFLLNFTKLLSHLYIYLFIYIHNVLQVWTSSSDIVESVVNASVAEITSFISNIENSSKVLESSTNVKLSDLVEENDILVNTTAQKALQQIRVSILIFSTKCRLIATKRFTFGDQYSSL